MKKTKTENKDVIFMALVVLTIIVVLLSMFAYSKYADTLEGKADVSIANWSFLVNGSESTITDLNLLETLETKEGVKDETLAPGRQGSFSVNIDASGSDVGVKYKVELQELKGVPQHLKFYTDKNYSIPLEQRESSYSLDGLIPYSPNEEDMIIDVDIYWKWEYETSEQGKDRNTLDQEDTEDSEENVTGKIIVSGWQVQPGESGSTKQ